MQQRRQPLVLVPSPRRWLIVGGASLAFVLLGVWFVRRGENFEGFSTAWVVFVGWASLLFFGLCLLIAIIQLIPGSAQLRLTDEGFVVRQMFRDKHYSWRDVSRFRVWKEPASGQSSVVFDVTGDSGVLASTNRRLTGGAGTGLPDTYGLDAEELAGIMEDWRRAA